MLHKVCNNNRFLVIQLIGYESIFGNTWSNGISTHFVFYVFTHMAKLNFYNASYFTNLSSNTLDYAKRMGKCLLH